MIRVPGHISAVFYPVYTGSPDTSGSLGAGFAVSVGCFTEILPSEELRVFVNGFETDEFTSLEALRLLGAKGLVYHYTEAPLGFGFGMSGACALGAVLEAARVNGIPLRPEVLAHYAHVAEVKLKTGLGDVIGEFYGGFEIRIKPGSPLTGRIIRVDPLGRHVAAIVFGELETPRILSDEELMKRILQAAEEALDMLSPDPRAIVEAGRHFSEASGLIDLVGLRRLYDELSREYDLVSMIMLSKGLFVLSRDPTDLIELKERFPENVRLSDVASGRTFIRKILKILWENWDKARPWKSQ